MYDLHLFATMLGAGNIAVSKMALTPHGTHSVAGNKWEGVEKKRERERMYETNKTQ